MLVMSFEINGYSRGERKHVKLLPVIKMVMELRLFESTIKWKYINMRISEFTSGALHGRWILNHIKNAVCTLQWKMICAHQRWPSTPRFSSTIYSKAGLSSTKIALDALYSFCGMSVRSIHLNDR